jgi:hypothetical protein
VHPIMLAVHFVQKSYKYLYSPCGYLIIKVGVNIFTLTTKYKETKT